MAGGWFEICYNLFYEYIQSDWGYRFAFDCARNSYQGSETPKYFVYYGGVGLEIYSIYLQDTIFIILQIIFTIAAISDLLRIKKENNLT